MKYTFNIYAMLTGLFFLVACEPETEPAPGITDPYGINMVPAGEYYGSVSRFIGQQSMGTTIGPGMVNLHAIDTTNYYFIFNVPGVLQETLTVAHELPVNTLFQDETTAYAVKGIFYTEQKRMWMEYSLNDTTYTFGGVLLY